MSTGLTYFVSFIAGYLSGSIMFAYIITKLILGKDIRDLGNNNPGAANTFKQTGAVWGILTGALDASKSLMPILIAHYHFGVSSISLGFIGIGAIIGHGYPIYFGFRGGRAAATLMGIYLFFILYELTVAFVVAPLFIYTVVKTNKSYWIPFGIVSLSAISSLFFNHPVEVKIIVIVAGFIGLFFNRNYLPLMVKSLFQKKEE